MKNLIRQGGTAAFLVTAFLLQFAYTDILPQTANDYRSKTSGEWSDASNWQRFSGSSWENAPGPPDSNAGRISILAGHVIAYNNQDYGVNELTVEPGAQLNVNSGISLKTSNAAGDEITLYGILYYTGTVPASMPGSGIMKTGSRIVYYSTSSPAALLNLFAVKETGSEWVYQGSSTTATYVLLGGRTYQNLSFESISGTYSPSFTGVSPLIVEGNFSIGSGVNMTVTNTAVNLFKGNYSISGNINYSTGSQTFSFAGTERQTLSGSGTLNFENININPGSLVRLSSGISISGAMNVSGIIECAEKTIGGTGSFSLLSGGMLKTSSQFGVNGNVVCAVSSFAADAGFEFNGTSSQMTGSKLTSCGILYINNSAGVSLSASLSVGSMLVFTSGKIYPGNYDIILGSAASVAGYGMNSYVATNGTGFLKKMSMPSGLDFLFPVGNSSYTPAVINNSGTADNYSVRTADTVDFRTNNLNYVKKKWVINEGSPEGTLATLMLCWNQSDQNPGFNPAGSVYVGRFDGSVCTEMSAAVSGSGPYTASVNGVSQFGEFAVGNESTLPAELTSFLCSVRNNEVELKWKTSGEINNQGFYVERRETGESSWTSRGFVRAAANPSGNNDYKYTDRVLIPGKYYFRLKQTDLNGGYAYYYMKDYCLIGPPEKFRLLGNYPNPFNTGVIISYEIPENCTVSVNFFEITGRKIREAYFKEYAGYSLRYFDFSGFASGVYIYYVRAMLAGGIMSAFGKCVLIK